MRGETAQRKTHEINRRKRTLFCKHLPRGKS